MYGNEENIICSRRLFRCYIRSNRDGIANPPNGAIPHAGSILFCAKFQEIEHMVSKYEAVSESLRRFCVRPWNDKKMQNQNYDHGKYPYGNWICDDGNKRYFYRLYCSWNCLGDARNLFLLFCKDNTSLSQRVRVIVPGFYFLNGS